MYRISHFLFLLVLLASCDSGSHKQKSSPLCGNWVSIMPNIGQEYVFQEDGSGKWIFSTDEGRDTIAFRYEWSDSFRPAHLDMFDFQSGILMGSRAWGIVDFKGNDTLKFDFQPGDAESERPRDFSNGGTIVYTRVKKNL